MYLSAAEAKPGLGTRGRSAWPGSTFLAAKMRWDVDCLSTEAMLRTEEGKEKVPDLFHCMHVLPQTQWKSDTKGNVVSATVKWRHFLQYTCYQRWPGLCDIRLLKHTVCEATSQNQPEKLAHITVATLGLQGLSAVLNWSIGITSFKSCQSIPSLMSYINSISVALLAHLALIGHLIGMPELVSFHWLTNS